MDKSITMYKPDDLRSISRIYMVEGKRKGREKEGKKEERRRKEEGRK